MKKHLLIGAVLMGGLVMAQMEGVGVQTEKPTETFHVEGTARISDLPINEATDAIYTNSGGERSDVKQPFNATKTVVVDDNGVLGVVEGVANTDGKKATTTTEEDGTVIYEPIRKCIRQPIGTDEQPIREDLGTITFPQSGFKFSWRDVGATTFAVYVKRIGAGSGVAKIKGVSRLITRDIPLIASSSRGTAAHDIEIGNDAVGLFNASFGISVSGSASLMTSNPFYNFIIDFATISKDRQKYIAMCIEQTVF